MGPWCERELRGKGRRREEERKRRKVKKGSFGRLK